ncbi:MAG: FG-GAP-like repeat-containing protein [Armatimonadota bacterium]
MTQSHCVVALVTTCLSLGAACLAADWPQYEANPFVIEMDLPAEDNGVGGIIVADVTGDGLLDYLVTKPGNLVVHDHNGRQLWKSELPIQVSESSEGHGLPGWHGPGVQAVDVDGDGETEVLFLTRDGVLHIVEGATGKGKRAARPPVPQGAAGWEHVIVANLRGQGDRDVILQATNKDGYRMGRYIAAYSLDALDGPALWQTDRYLGCAHNGARVADLDGDGRDEVLGATILDHDGTLHAPFRPEGHLDSIFVYDMRPDLDGLEVVALEEGGGNDVYLFNRERLIWQRDHKHQEPQNAAVGDFDPARAGLEIWCRSRYNEHQKPFVFDAQGEVISDYEMDNVAPEGWTTSGVETICVVDWTGEPKQLAAAKERHEAGDVCVFDPMGGRFVEHFPEKADRLYVADVSGDWREELIVVSGSEIHVYHNEAPNPRPNQPRLWERQHYRRSKMTWNYYSP